MTRLHKGILALAFLVLMVPATPSQAQLYGYGGYGYGAYGYPGYGYGYGVPGFGYGYGVPGYVVGYPPVGYYGYGGVPGLGLGYSGISYGYFGNPYIGIGPPLVSGVGDTNPLFGVGLTPLGVQSALGEGALIRASRPRAVKVDPPVAKQPEDGTGSARPR